MLRQTLARPAKQTLATLTRAASVAHRTGGATVLSSVAFQSQQPLQWGPKTPVATRNYATENTDVDPKLVEIIYKMQTTPAVMAAIQEFERLVRLKGFDRQTGFGQFYSFMKDKEIEQALQQIMMEMDNAGIRISADIVQPLLHSMSRNFSGTPFK